MRLDTITRIERFIVDALMTSPQVPLGVNVVRLAATQDVEGIVNAARTIVVRYTGSSVTTTSRSPLVTEQLMSFQIDLAAQEYLTESGHDYVIQMCAACLNTLTNAVPMNTGVDVIEPFYMASEAFQGLTDNSQYVYTQTWNLLTQKTYPQNAVDPCVQRGNCSYLFPENTLSNIKIGDVLLGNNLYEPVMPLDGVYHEEFCGVEVRGDDLVYRVDTDRVFLADYENFVFVPTGTTDVTNTFQIVNIYAKDDRSKPVGRYFASNCKDRKLIQIGGNQPAYAGSQWVGGLYRSAIGAAGDPVNSAGPEVMPAVFAQKNGYGYVYTDRAIVTTNPAEENASKATVRFGTVFTTLVDTTLTVDGVEYRYVGGTPVGKAWIRTDQYQLFEAPPYVECEQEGITPGVPEGTQAIDSGPITECDIPE